MQNGRVKAVCGLESLFRHVLSGRGVLGRICRSARRTEVRLPNSADLSPRSFWHGVLTWK